MVVFGVSGAEGRWFESNSSCHIGTLGKSFTRSCLYNMMWHPVWCLAGKFDSYNNSLLPSVHTLPVIILRCVRLYIKRKYYYYYNVR